MSPIAQMASHKHRSKLASSGQSNLASFIHDKMPAVEIIKFESNQVIRYRTVVRYSITILY